MKLLFWLFITGLLISSYSQCHAAGIDLNHDGLDDLWVIQFNAQSAMPDADNDGDGFSNAAESFAGTNPFDASSLPRLQSLSLPNAVELNWTSVPGKRYRLQSRTNLLSGSWADEILAATGLNLGEVQLPLDHASKFFRLSIDDVDSDADGVTDYNERLLGFDPLKDHSGNNDLTDWRRLTNGLNAASTVTVAVLDGGLSERWPEPGLVAIRRSGGLRPITINIALGGTAIVGADYLPSVTNVLTLPAGARETWIELVPLADDESEVTETIAVTLLPGNGYTVGASNAVTLELENATPGPSAKEAARFLIQAAFGPDQDSPNDSDIVPENVEEVMAMGFEAWLDDQFNRPANGLQPWVDWAAVNGQQQQLYGNAKENAWWNRAMGVAKLRPDSPTNTIPDPLRQRIAFALSEILVTSDRPEQLAVEQVGMANYYDLMIQHAFGNYRDLLYDVARHPVMGIYLSHLGNRKANPANKVYPDENFAREIMQLFSIGLWELNQDGTRRLTNGLPIATYDNGDITELARVFTGLSFGNNVNFVLYPRDFTQPMKCWDAEHDCNAKTLLGGLQLPTRTASPGNVGTAGLADVDTAIGNLFAHTNVGPFIGRQLIQRLVTSNPSTGYVARVSAAFTDNGAGVRGDLKAVIKAILLDSEARGFAMLHQPTWGKLREPFLRVVNFARAFNAASTSGWYPLDQFTLDHMQDPMNAPSVFNFFLPTHSPPGPLTQLGLVAPEFQILNASSAITGPNYFWNAILGDLHRWGVGNAAYAVRPNLTNELALIVPSAQIGQDVPSGPVGDPDPLLRRLDLALTGGTLSPQQFQIIREAMLRVNPPSWQWHRERLRLAIYLIVTSADFNVLR